MSARPLETRSVLLGLGLAALVFLGLGARDDATSADRYRMSAYGTSSASGVYILDTETGQLWHRGTPITTASRTFGLGTVDKPRLDEISLTN